jgi:hypothetical protein
MTSLPERTPKKTTVHPIVALPSNGCKQAFPLLTVDLQCARHNTVLVQLLLNDYIVQRANTMKLKKNKLNRILQLHKYCIWVFTAINILLPHQAEYFLTSSVPTEVVRRLLCLFHAILSRQQHHSYFTTKHKRAQTEEVLEQYVSCNR